VVIGERNSNLRMSTMVMQGDRDPRHHTLCGFPCPACPPSRAPSNIMPLHGERGAQERPSSVSGRAGRQAVDAALFRGMENETNHIITTLDRANACTMMACDDFEHTVEHSRLLSRRLAFRHALPSCRKSFGLAIYQTMLQPGLRAPHMTACLIGARRTWGGGPGPSERRSFQDAAGGRARF
jgi:hypothetical protein